MRIVPFLVLFLSTAAASAENQVCLRVASRDGIYTSRNVYELPKGESRPIHLPYKSKQEKQVKPYVKEVDDDKFVDSQIALVATPGDCYSRSSNFLLVSRQEPTEQSEVVIHLNSFGATDVFYMLDDEERNLDDADGNQISPFFSRRTQRMTTISEINKTIEPRVGPPRNAKNESMSGRKIP